MKKFWSIKTNGKPLETVLKIIADIWNNLEIKGMILPLKNTDGIKWEVEVISNPDDLYRANPFTPLMVENIAPKVAEYQKDHPGKLFGALLRPCEIEALNKIAPATGLDYENLIIFSADCLGTFPADEYSWRADRKGSNEALSDEALHFSRQGGIAAYRYRAACQLCKNPIADRADINFNIVGMPVRQHLLVSSYNGISEKLNIAELGENFADQETIKNHSDVAQKLIYRNQQTSERLSQALVENTDLDIDNLVDQLNECGDCQVCMQVCPICSTHDIHRDQNGNLDRESVVEWMMSCVGCGMCEQSCVQHKPLAVIFSVINKQLQEIH
jgi:NAD-dependent dihydropyrimidine dehydrogenase PreA subunit